MKKQTNILLSLFALLALGTSCSDFLDEEPQSTWGIDDFYNNSTEADIALAGIYSIYASDNLYGQAMSVIMESGTDEGYYNRRYNDAWTVGLYRHTSADNYVQNLWTSLYQIINLSNIFIERLNKTEFEDQEYNQYIAEAKFLRAQAYSLLVDWYEEVPLRLTPTLDQSANQMAASSLEDLYDQIISDFTFASENLLKMSNSNYTPGRANALAANGLMARAYLKMAGYPLYDETKYALALEQCEIVINSGEHSLTPSTTEIQIDPDTGEDKIVTLTDGYRTHFLNYIENTYDTQESLFEISFKYLRENGIDVHGRIGGINGVPFSYGGGDDGYPGAIAMFNTTPVLHDSYVSNNDSIRKAWNVPAMLYTSSGDARAVTSKLSVSYCPGKYRRWEPTDFDDLTNTPENGQIEPYTLLEANATPNRNFTGVNFPVLRYADILLMSAEAENALNGPTSIAKGYLNQVRQRAGVANIDDVRAGDVASQQGFQNEIVDARLREFCFEGLRKHDLIRWNLLESKLNYLNEAIKGDPNYNANNEDQQAFLRAGNNFDPTKHMSLPYPLQEVNINDLLDQKPGW